MTGLLLARSGFQPPGIEDFETGVVVHLHLLGMDLSINRAVLLMFLAAVIVAAMFLTAFRRPQLVPRGMQNFMEAGIEFVRDQIVLDIIGPEGLRFLPYMTTIFFFIFVGNIFEIVPGIEFPVNARMALPAFLALLSWIIFNAVGIREKGLRGYLKSVLFPPGVPLVLYILVTPIEIVSTLIVRPITLSIRLLANMVAGHILLSVFFVGTSYLLAGGFTKVFAVASFAMAVLLVAFELFVAALQAYIFTILTAVYVAGALSAEH